MGGFWHHAAIVYEPEGLEDCVLYEAVSTGVRRNYWSHIRENLGPNEFYESVAIRKLTCNRDQKFKRKVEKYFKEVDGLNYGVSQMVETRYKRM